MEENKYRYNDISERLRRMNRIYMGATIFMAALILLYLWMKQMNHNIKTVTVYGNTVLLLAFTVVNAVIYCRNKATSKLKVAVTMEMGIEYLLIGMQTDAHFITYILIVSLALQIPYYDKKGLRRTSIGLGILYILVTVVQSVKGINVIDVDTICGIWGVLGISLSSQKSVISRLCLMMMHLALSQKNMRRKNGYWKGCLAFHNLSRQNL